MVFVSVWISSSLLSWEEILGRGPPSNYALHLTLHELLQASPELTQALLLCPCCKARANTTLCPKRMAVFHPTLPKQTYNSRNSGTLPLIYTALLHFFLMLHILSSNKTPFPFAEVQYSVFSISNSRLWEQKLRSLVNQTEMNTRVYGKSVKTNDRGSTCSL